MSILLVAALAFATALLAGPAVLWGLRRVEVFDVPSPRSSHLCATPRGGGVAPALACVLAVAVSTQLAGRDRDALLFASVALGLIGLADDFHPRRALPRLVGQLVVASVTLIWLIRGMDRGELAAVGAGAAIVLGLVGYTNAFNFMDGINGLALAQVMVAGGTWWILGVYQHVPAFAAAGAIAAGAATGFAPFNTPRARMFLGDVGSYFLGGWLAITAAVGLGAGIAPEAVLAPLAVFLADAGMTLVQRIRRHEPLARPHKEHTYQRLVHAGWSHAHTTLVVGLLMATTSALGALSVTGPLALRGGGDAAIVVLLVGYRALPARLAGTSLADKSISDGATTATP